MRSVVAIVLVAAAVSGLGPVPADACGDKLLVLGRRVKRVPAAKHPASVLLYMRSGSALPTAAKAMKLESTLRQAGHRVDRVDEPDRLRGHLTAGGYDFVFTDLPDATSVVQEAGSAPGRPEVVPVAYKASEAALRDSRGSFRIVVRAGKSLSYLAALDLAMRQRMSTGPRN
jgi:hypothetical protein